MFHEITFFYQYPVGLFLGLDCLDAHDHVHLYCDIHVVFHDYNYRIVPVYDHHIFMKCCNVKNLQFEWI